MTFFFVKTIINSSLYENNALFSLRICRQVMIFRYLIPFQDCLNYAFNMLLRHCITLAEFLGMIQVSRKE